MDLLADQTGGIAYRNTNDLKRAIRQAVDDGRVTYTLGLRSGFGKLGWKISLDSGGSEAVGRGAALRK